MKTYTVQFKYAVEQTVRVEVLADSEEEAIDKAQDGEVEYEHIVNEKGWETKDYEIV